MKIVPVRRSGACVLVSEHGIPEYGAPGRAISIDGAEKCPVVEDVAPRAERKLDERLKIDSGGSHDSDERLHRLLGLS
jgi:hypothetical protein